MTRVRARPVDVQDDGISGWQLRGALVVCALLAVAVAVAGETAERLTVVSLAGSAVLIAGMVLLPSSLFTTAFLVVLCLPVLDRPEPPLLGLVVVAALVHAVHLLAALTAVGPPSTRYAVAALVPSARRWAVCQALAIPVVAGVWWTDTSQMEGGGVSDRVEVAAGVLAAVLLFGTVALARRRMR
jgi:hypothetical protein